MKYYVYIYLNPLKKGDYVYKKFKFDYEPFYVGLGKGDRMNSHTSPNSLKIKSFKNNIILKILNSGMKPIRFKLYENITLESAKRLEIYLIKLIGRRNLKLGSLSNLTDGGEGIKGVVFTEEMRERKRGENNFFYNKHHSEETKEKIRISIGDKNKGESNPNYNNKWTDDMKKESSTRQKETHKHLTGDNNPARKEDVRKKISDGKIGLLNPMSKKWILISPDGVEHIIEGGVKRNLLLYGLNYQQFDKDRDKPIRKNSKGWILKEI